MARPSKSIPTPRRIPVGLTALVVMTFVVGARSISGGPGASNDPAETSRWRTGKPLAIQVVDDKARFSIATPGAGSKTLVIVSVLARSAGSFDVRLSAKGVAPEAVETPVQAPEGRHLPPWRPRGPLAPVQAPTSKSPPRERVFHLLVRDGDVASASNYLAVKGNLRAVGQRVQVYVDQGDDRAGQVNLGVLRDLVRTFDDAIFPSAARTIGQARDVDGDGRFTVFMSSWLTRLAGGRHAVDGYVRGADLDLGLAAPYSNHGDMMYLSTALSEGPHLRTVVAHEYTHAVTFSAKALVGPGLRVPGPEEEGWLDEAIAHLVEDQHGYSRSNLDYRVSAFLSRPEAYRLVVEDYYAADLFRSHGNRGATYLFLRWCADRYGTELVPALVRSKYRGIENIEAATGERFEDLYRSWTTALFFSGFDPSHDDASALKSLDVRQPFESWDLAGPRVVSIAPGGPLLSWRSVGTASRYVIVEHSPTGAAEVSIEAPTGSNLQVTAVPLPEDLADLELTAFSEAGTSGVPCLRFVLKESGGRTAVKISSLAWEPLIPGPDPHSPGFRRERLNEAAIASSFGSSMIAGRGSLASKPIPTLAAFGQERIVFKAVGTDALGRRVAAWAELPGAEITLLEASKPRNRN